MCQTITVNCDVKWESVDTKHCSLYTKEQIILIFFISFSFSLKTFSLLSDHRNAVDINGLKHTWNHNYSTSKKKYINDCSSP